MHIPEMMLQGAVCPVTAAAASVGLAGTVYAAYKTKMKPAASYFAGVTALIFAAQMANFPILEGTSGHFLGATLAVALLGSAFGILAMSLVVIAQCFVFVDGGISVLGANLLNMSLIAAIPAIIVREWMTSDKKIAYVAAAFASVVFAAGACAVQLAISGAAPLNSVLPAMLSVHALIGLAEAGLTVAALLALSYAASAVTPQRAWMIPLGLAAVVAVIISPFAAATPDGLESVVGTLGCACPHHFCILHTPAAWFSTPFAGYTVPVVNSAILSTALAGFIGITVLFLTAYGTGRVFAAKKTNR